MKPRILLFYFFSLLLVPLHGQDSDTLLFSQVFEPEEISRIYSHSSEKNPGIALIQPGIDSLRTTDLMENKFLLDHLNPSWVLELEPLATQEKDSLYRSDKRLISLQNALDLDPSTYEVIPRISSSIKRNRTLLEYQESFNYISDFVLDDAHVFTIGIGSEKFELSQKTLDHIRQKIAQYSNTRRILVFLSFPPEILQEIQGFKDLINILDEKSSFLFLPFSAAGHSLGETHTKIHYLRKPEANNQLYWISLSGDSPTLSQVSLENPGEFSSECNSILDDIGTKMPIKTTALWDRSVDKPQGYLEINVQNPSSFPIRLKADFVPNSQIYPSIGEIETTIYPGSDKTLRVQLRSLSKVDSVLPSFIEWAWELGCMRTQDVSSSLSGILPIHLTSEPIKLLSAEKWAFTQTFPLSLRPPIDNATIHYTLNGDEPTLESPIVSDTLEITESGMLKTKVFHSNGSHSQTESCMFTKVSTPFGLWQDFYPVPSSYSLGGVSSLLSTETPHVRKALSSLREVPVSTSLKDFVQVLGAFLEVTDTSIYTLDFYRMPRILVRINKGELQEYLGEPLPFSLAPGKHLIEIISLETKQPRELNMNLRDQKKGNIPINTLSLE